MALEGLHHVTAITADAPRNVDFYARLLGLRLVKKTVNFDDPGTYHLYYGDEAGQPGTILTFFSWEHSGPGRLGVGAKQFRDQGVEIGTVIEVNEVGDLVGDGRPADEFRGEDQPPAIADRARARTASPARNGVADADSGDLGSGGVSELASLAAPFSSSPRPVDRLGLLRRLVVPRVVGGHQLVRRARP